MPTVRALFALACAALLLAAAPAGGASSDVVVSQVYAGGGNTGAAYANDYVELLNRGSSAVDLSSWTVQYATASGTAWQATPLTGTLAPGRFYLVQLASAGAVGAPLPAPDATGTTNLAASGGKVAVVRDTAALTCGAAAGSCSAVPLVADLVGYGSATDFEGAGPAPALSSTTAALRGGGGCADTDVNSADFAAGPPAPRNGAAAAVSCGAAPPATTALAGATVSLDVAPAVSIALDRTSLAFGAAATGDTPAPLPEHVTVVSNDGAGYSLTVSRSAFAPADLPLGLSAAAAPAGAALGPALAGGGIVPVPVAPAPDLLVGSSPARSAAGGDVWSTAVGFASPLPQVAAGHYTASVTFTVVGL